MKVGFGLERKDLLVALEKTSKALSAAPTESVLKNFLIETWPNGVWVSASDNVVTSSTYVGAKIASQGRMLLPATKGMELIKKAHGEYIVVGLSEDGSAFLACGTSKWSMPTRDVKTYPETGIDGYEAESHEVDKYELYSAIDSVHKAMSPSLAGFSQVSIRDGRVRASDGVWFQEAWLPNSGKNLDIAIPRAVVKNVLAFLSHWGSGTVKIFLTDGGKVVFRDEGDMLSFPLPAQKTPDLSKAFAAPAMTNHDDLTVSRKELREAIDRVAVIADSETQAISLDLSAAGVDTVVVSAKSRDGSWAEDTVKCKWVGQTRRVLLHKEYILNALASFVNTQQVKFYLGPDSPSNPSQVLIQGAGKQAVLNQLRPDLV